MKPKYECISTLSLAINLNIAFDKVFLGEVFLVWFRHLLDENADGVCNSLRLSTEKSGVINSLAGFFLMTSVFVGSFSKFCYGQTACLLTILGISLRSWTAIMELHASEVFSLW